MSRSATTQNNVLYQCDNMADFRSRDVNQSAENSTETPVDVVEHDYDGAVVYVVVVVLVYGMAIMAMIGSTVRRKNARIAEDQRTEKYLLDSEVSHVE